MSQLVWLEGKHIAQTAHCALVPELFQNTTRNCAHLLRTFNNYYAILSTYNVIWSIVTLCLIKAYAIEICIKYFDKLSALNSKNHPIFLLLFKKETFREMAVEQTYLPPISDGFRKQKGFF